MITAREPKQDDASDTDPVESRRGMRLVQGGRSLSKPPRIAIGDDVFPTRPTRPAHIGRPTGKKITSITDDVDADGQRSVGAVRSGASGSRALGIAIAVAACGLVLNYLFGERRKS